MEQLDFTLLTYEQVFGEQKLDIFNKYGTECAITDFSILLGGYVSSDYCTSEGKTLKDRTGWWWTKSFDVDNYARVVDENGYRVWNYVNERNGGARPALPYSSIASNSSNGVRGRNGILEVEYGEYPQTIVSKSLSRRLDKAYFNETIIKTGKCYVTDSVKSSDIKIDFNVMVHFEYEYKGKKYINIYGNSDSEGKMLSDGRIIKKGESYWVKVEPIKWMIDEKTDIALSKMILFSGVQFNHMGNYDGDFENTTMKMFLDEFFRKDIIPLNYEDKIAEKDDSKDKVHMLIDEINMYISYCNNQEEIRKRVNNLLDRYNNDIEMFLSSRKILNINTEDSLRIKLIIELEEILAEIKISYLKKEPYLNILKVIDEYLKILSGEDGVLTRELAKDLSQVVVVNKFIDNGLINEFKTIIEGEISKINLFLDNIDSKDNLLEYTNVDEFDLYIRKLIHSLLVRLNLEVVKKDVVTEITNLTKEKYLETFEEGKNNIINLYLRAIKEELEHIKEVDTSMLFQKDIDKILPIDISKDNSIEEICVSLKELLNKLIEIKFKLDDSKIRNNKLKSLKILSRI